MRWLFLLAGCAATSVDSDRDTDVPAEDVVCVDAWQTVPGAPETFVAAGVRYCYDEDRPGDGKFDRMSAETCRPEANHFRACDGTYQASACATDAECGGGSCLFDYDGIACECVATCATDADCASGELCACSAAITVPDRQDQYLQARNECIPATCRTASDCGASDCGVQVETCNGAVQAACRTADDACSLHSDCDPMDGIGCLWSSEAAWSCDGMATTCQ